MTRPPRLRVFLLATATIVSGLELLAPAGNATAPSHKTYSETVTPTSISAGPIDLLFTITNTSTGSSAVPYGSFQLKVPSGITVDTASLPSGPANFNAPAVNSSVSPATITVTSNGPTGSGIASLHSLTMEVTGTATPGVCPGTWLTEVKQSNDFSGTGNDFGGNSVSTPVSGGTKLVWTTQPSDTEFDLNMSPAPKVTVEDGCGAPVTTFTDAITVTDSAGVLKGTPLSVVPTSGVATFSSVQFTDYGVSDTLVATSTGALSSCAADAACNSASFNIFQLRKPCSTSGGTCNSNTLTGKQGTTQANIVASSGTTPDVLTVNVKGLVQGYHCNDTTPEQSYGEAVTLDVAHRTKTVTLTLTKSYVLTLPNNGTPFMDICLDTTTNGTFFTDKSGNSVQIGLIPDCSVTGNVPPCVVSRKKNQANEIITANLPQGDPSMIFHG